MLDSIKNGDVRNYLNDERSHSILSDFNHWIENSNTNISIARVEHCQRDEFADYDGYVDDGKKVFARYYSESRVVKLNTEIIAQEVDNVQQKFISDTELAGHCKDVYLFADLILAHEYAHAYQSQIEGKSMKRDDNDLERDADRMAIRFFTEVYDEPQDEVKKTIMEHYEHLRRRY